MNTFKIWNNFLSETVQKCTAEHQAHLQRIKLFLNFWKFPHKFKSGFARFCGRSLFVEKEFFWSLSFDLLFSLEVDTFLTYFKLRGICWFFTKQYCNVFVLRLTTILSPNSKNAIIFLLSWIWKSPFWIWKLNWCTNYIITTWKLQL